MQLELSKCALYLQYVLHGSTSSLQVAGNTKTVQLCFAAAQAPCGVCILCRFAVSASIMWSAHPATLQYMRCSAAPPHTVNAVHSKAPVELVRRAASRLV